ncbi:MarR family transcriptional regulator [Nonomuraea sp. NPDC048916]|uniref:MarR family winged helix-turn-helix transcriptional regulator n=1 Tax=Nonomuraea sp. NPDC048916 TaxID=3154232 RepID=UPI0033CA0D93
MEPTNELEAGVSHDTDPEESTVEWQVARTQAEHGPDFDPDLLTLTLTFYRAMSAFDRAGAAELAVHGLSVSQFNILNVLHRADRPLNMGELALAISIRPANLTSVIDGLVQRSFVERRINPDDRRSYLIANTETGERFLAEFLPSHWRYLEALIWRLDGEDRRTLTALLAKLRDSIETARVDKGQVVST